MENNEALKKVLDLNQVIKSKSKPQLTKKLQKEVDELFEPVLSNQEAELLNAIIEMREPLAAPFKQGIVECLRSHPVQKTLTPQIVELLHKFKGNAKRIEYIVPLSVLGLLHYGQYHDEDILILKEFLETSAEKKKIASKFCELFEFANFSKIVEILFKCRRILKLIEKEQFDDLKKRILDTIRDVKDDPDSAFLQGINRLEKLMAQGEWQRTVRDKALESNISEIKKRLCTASKESTQAKKDTSHNVEGKNSTPRPPVSRKTEANSDLTNHQHTSQLKPTYKSSRIEKAKPDDQKFVPIKNKHPDREKKKSSIFDALNAPQEKVLTELIDLFSKLNRNDSENQKRIANLKRNLSSLERKREDLKRAINDCEQDIQKKEKLLDELRGRLSSLREQHEREQSRFRREIAGYKSEVERVRTENEELRERLDNLAKELERERKLSHATHRDAENRAKVELESKTRSIYEAVSPIFKEVEEFESMTDLPSRAQMLLNIFHKMKNALVVNGIQI